MPIKIIKPSVWSFKAIKVFKTLIKIRIKIKQGTLSKAMIRISSVARM